MEKKVYSVDAIDLSIQKTNPPRLVITATGTVNSSGWRNARLDEYVYIDFPADGYWEFDMVAEAPAGTVLHVMSPIAASHIWEGDLARLKGVRIYAATNEMERELVGVVEVDLPERKNPKFASA